MTLEFLFLQKLLRPGEDEASSHPLHLYTRSCSSSWLPPCSANPAGRKGNANANPCDPGAAARQGERALSAAALPRLCQEPSCQPILQEGSHGKSCQHRNFGVQSLAKSFHHIPGEMSPHSAGTSKHSEGRSAVNSSKVSWERVGSQRELNGNIYHISSRFSAVTASFAQQVYLTHLYWWVQESAGKAAPQTNLWQCFWPLTTIKSAVFPHLWPQRGVYHCWAAVRSIILLLQSTTAPAPWLCRKEWGAGGHTYNTTPTRGDSDNVAALGSKGLQKTLPFLRLHTDGKLSLRQQRAGRPKDHWRVKWGLAQSCSLTTPSFSGNAKEKTKEGSVAKGSLPPHRTVLLHHCSITNPPAQQSCQQALHLVNSEFSQETALQLLPKLMSSQRGLEKSLTFG